MNGSLLALLELAAATRPDSENLTIEEQFPAIVAEQMRYEMLLRNAVDNSINEHLAGISAKDLIKAKTAYDRDYFLSLPLPYSGIQKLCKELVSACRKLKVPPTTDWQNFADGVFNWEEDISNMGIEMS